MVPSEFTLRLLFKIQCLILFQSSSCSTPASSVCNSVTSLVDHEASGTVVVLAEASHSSFGAAIDLDTVRAVRQQLLHFSRVGVLGCNTFVSKFGIA